MIFGALKRLGILGINERNAEYTLRCNPRHLYPRVDDKLETKRLCTAAGIPVPQLFGVARAHFETRSLIESLVDRDSFVLKPARGAMGNGIVVVVGREGARFRRAGGRLVSAEDLRYHAASIISGLYALAGQPDVALVEERLEAHPTFAEVTSGGVPDVRVITYRGVPVMAMTRLPTRRSGGRANLHQGAIGVGIDLATGRTTHAILAGRPVTRNPDTGVEVTGRFVPAFARVLDIAIRACDATELGYIGADVVVDARQGPMILELNARPGLVIQLANRSGLLPRLRAVDAAWREGLTVEERIRLGQRIAGVT